jgi:glycosyltransferase involved in cell wall biosynthesis
MNVPAADRPDRRRRPRRVLHALPTAGLGGQETLCLGLAAHLDPSRWVSEVAALTAEDGPARRRLAELGVPVHDCPHRRGRYWELAARVRRICRERRIDAVVSYGLGLHVWVGLGARLAGVGWHVVAHGNFPPAAGAGLLKDRLLTAAGLAVSDADVAASRHVADGLVRRLGLPAARVRVVWNWIDAAGIAARAQAARAARRGGAGPVVGMIARLDPIKDHAAVLEAFARFAARTPGAVLRLVGDGVLRPALEARAARPDLAGRVEFLGARTDVAEQLGGLDLFAYATTPAEGFGIVLAEAMAAGVPIVAADAGPVREVLADGRGGRLTPAGDPAAMAEALSAAWADPAGRARMADDARALAEERYSLPAAMRRFAGVLDDGPSLD